MNKKLLIPIVTIVVLVAGFATYSVAFAKKGTPPKVTGTIYILPKSFTINLTDGNYAALTAALLLAPGQSVGVTSATDPPPTGFGALTDEAIVRSIITNVITDESSAQLLSATGRAATEQTILKEINAQTDLKVKAIYFTDLAVQ